MSLKRLYVLRHAKSSWDDPRLADHERPLSPRGRGAAQRLAGHFREAGIEPGYVLCSPSRRTRETLTAVLGDAPALIDPALYGASGRELLAVLHGVPEHAGSVLLVGHNPAVRTLVLGLAIAPRDPGSATGSRPALEAIEAIERKFPTGALATLEFEGPWSKLTFAGARLAGYVRPKTLA